MKRIVMKLTVALIMAAMMVASVVPGVHPFHRTSAEVNFS
jgi:hypothetical protein